MKKIIDIINDEIRDTQKGIECLPCERVNLDHERYSEYKDADEHKATDIFEYPNPGKDTLQTAFIPHDIPSILKYFLDGSRKTYKIADLKVKGRYLPLVAGQVAVGVMVRDDNNSINPNRRFCHYENVIAFPDEISNDDDRKHLVNSISSKSSTPFQVIIYSVKEDRDPIDLGVAKIMAHMAGMELNAVHELSNNSLLQSNSLLVKDGPLRYKNLKGHNFDITQFRNVIGVSKRFRPSFTLGSGRKKVDVGVLTSSLEMGERTPVFKTEEEDKFIGMWYLRIRPKNQMINQLQGIIKVECYAIDKIEEEQGLNSDRVNTISEYLLRERNVTPYGQDYRWATHLYPIFLAESYIKSCMFSNLRFEGLF